MGASKDNQGFGANLFDLVAEALYRVEYRRQNRYANNGIGGKVDLPNYLIMVEILSLGVDYPNINSLFFQIAGNIGNT